jgi:hypothetical protein
LLLVLLEVSEGVPRVTTLRSSPRQRVPFDYNWRFHLGDPEGVMPALTAATEDTSFVVNISGMACEFWLAGACHLHEAYITGFWLSHAHGTHALHPCR